MSIGIYKITNLINNKIYIGQSINIEKRINAHFAYAFSKGAKEYNTPIHNAIRLYGKESFKWEILKECTEEELDDLEIYYISLYNSTDRNIGYNLTTGGFGGHKTNCRHILQYDLDGNFIREWNSIWDAAKELGLSKDAITACCYGQKSACGFQWKFSDDEKEIKKYVRNWNLKGLELGRHPVPIIAKNEKLKIEIGFKSIKEAAEWLIEQGFSKAKNIDSICSRISTIKDTDKISYGFQWKTKEVVENS